MALAGSASYPGAARLATEAAYRVGAGLVTLACPDSLRAIVAPSTPEVTYVPLGSVPAVTPEGARAVVAALDGYDVLLIGPGLSQADGVKEAIVEVLTRVPRNVRACVIDADGLNALAKWDHWASEVTVPLILTPHPGEMSRLTRRTIAEIQDDRLNSALAAAAEWRQIVVLKGAHTIVAAPDGRALISPHATALLATAGTGDVLTGAIAGLLAQGMPPFDAAASAVFIHGTAAEDVSEAIGDRGLLASDLLASLPRAIRVIREGKAANAGPSALGGLQNLGNLAEMLGHQ
jgi:NAD(P)H-hydrate epimerase